jgi:hypothetical protein
MDMLDDPAIGRANRCDRRIRYFQDRQVGRLISGGH